MLMCYRILSRAVSALVYFHDEQNKAKSGGNLENLYYTKILMFKLIKLYGGILYVFMMAAESDNPIVCKIISTVRE